MKEASNSLTLIRKIQSPTIWINLVSLDSNNGEATPPPSPIARLSKRWTGLLQYLPVSHVHSRYMGYMGRSHERLLMWQPHIRICVFLNPASLSSYLHPPPPNLHHYPLCVLFVQCNYSLSFFLSISTFQCLK